MTLYSFNIDKMLRLIVDLDDAAITSSDSTVGTPINKSACHIQVTSGGNVVSSEVCHFHSVGNAFEVNICWSWRTPCFLCSIWDPIDTDVTTTT
jgi:MoaA/NifB/PqqE/SkfB family radical SAM enzyme